MVTDEQKRRGVKETTVWPFNQVDYLIECPNGHSLQLGTGYSVHAPRAWQQWGQCLKCSKAYNRTITQVDGKFVPSELKEGMGN